MFPEQRGGDGARHALVAGQRTLPRQPVRLARGLLQQRRLAAAATPRRRRAQKPEVLQPGDDLLGAGRLLGSDVLETDVGKLWFVAILPPTFMFSGRQGL